MKAKFTDWVTRHPLYAFYILAFALTWAGWIPQTAYSHGLFPFDSPVFYLLGGVGPLLAAFFVLRILHGGEVYAELFRPLSFWKVGPFWYIVALLGYPAIWLIALAMRGELSAGIEQLSPPANLLPVFLISFLAAISEEVAWRGFSLPRLQSRYNALLASLIVGVLWAVWHLPLLLNKGSVMSTYPLMPYLLQVIAISVVYTWIFNSTGGSLLIVTLFHAASNTVGPFPGLEQTLVTILVAAGIVMVFGAAYLSRREGRIVPAGR